MSTTTIRLSEELKARVADAAERAGKTTHAFIIEAIAEKAAAEESRAGMAAEAGERFANVIATGKTVPWKEVRAYLEQRISGRPAPRPTPLNKRA